MRTIAQWLAWLSLLLQDQGLNSKLPIIRNWTLSSSLSLSCESVYSTIARTNNIANNSRGHRWLHQASTIRSTTTHSCRVGHFVYMQNHLKQLVEMWGTMIYIQKVDKSDLQQVQLWGDRLEQDLTLLELIMGTTQLTKDVDFVYLSETETDRIDWRNWT